MPMGVDHAGDERAALAIIAEAWAVRALLAARKALFHAPVIADHKASEVNQIAALVDSDAVHIVDEALSVRLRCAEAEQERRQKRAGPCCKAHGLRRRLTRALVSCRPPPMATTSA